MMIGKNGYGVAAWLTVFLDTGLDRNDDWGYSVLRCNGGGRGQVFWLRRGSDSFVAVAVHGRQAAPADERACAGHERFPHLQPTINPALE